MSRKSKNVHVGGQQMPMFVPSSNWTTPTELPDLRRIGRVALDRETRDLGLAAKVGPGWATGAGCVVGSSYSWREGDQIRSVYVPIEHPDTEGCFSREQVSTWERDLQRAGVRFVMQNAPYDVGWGDRDLGVPCPERIDDTTCMAYMIDERRLEYGLDALCAWRGLPGKDDSLLREAAAVYGLQLMEELYKLPARFVGPYAEADATQTLLLAESLEPELEKQGVRRAYDLEMDLLPVVHAMRKRGVRIDEEAAWKQYDHFLAVSRQAFEDLSEKLGTTCGIDEARQNSWLERAFTDVKEPFPRDQFTQRGSFEAKWMKQRKHWLPLLLVRGKSYHEAAEKFVKGFLIDFAHQGRLHASISQFKSDDGGTRTYRFAYSDPPLQQMPNRDEELSSGIRGAFEPEEGELWLAADYSQQEYRLIVHYAAKYELRKAEEAAERYRTDPRTDFHSMVAEMTGLERKPAKDTNFAKAYGAGVKKFAFMIGKSEEEAAQIMGQYDREMPFVKELYERCQSKAERTGFVRLLDGARIRFDTWEPRWISKEQRSRGWSSGGKYKMAPCSLAEARERSTDEDHPWYGARLRRADCRKAMNGLIQGGAARQTKRAMVECWRAGYLPLLQLHDELDFSVSEERHGREITQIMREAVPLRVPMQVDAEYGPTWGAAKAKGDYDASWSAAKRAVRGTK